MAVKQELKEEKKQEEKKEEPVQVQLSVLDEIKQNQLLIDRAVVTIEDRFTARVLRTLTTLRKRLDATNLSQAIMHTYGSNTKCANTRSQLESYVHLLPASKAPEGDAMQIDAVEEAAPASVTTAEADKDKEAKVEKPYEPTPESDVYIRLLVLLALLDEDKLEQATALAHQTAAHIRQLSRRTMDALAAKIYFYLARTAELKGKDQEKELRPLLLEAQSTATLREDVVSNATLINLLLRSYLSSNLHSQADALLAKAPFPDSAPPAQTARYLFYTGRLRAIQLNYSAAHEFLQAAIRRAPADGMAKGFVQMVHKYYVVVVLLTGVIPERSVFRREVLKTALAPYFQIVQAVRVGDVQAFQNAFNTHQALFLADGTHFLILRLRHFVLKTALRTITLAYSRISLRDICLKLGLDSEEDTEYIVAKAINDGVIDATLDHARGAMESVVVRNLYETDEPRKEFMARVGYCNRIRNDSVQAMRYPLNAHRKDLDSADALRERERDMAQIIAEGGDFDDDDDDMEI